MSNFKIAVGLLVSGAVALVLLLSSGNRLLTSAACPVVDGQPVQALAENTSSSPSVKEQTAENLVALAKVWGIVRYFHPKVETSDIDWDLALIEALPNVEKAASGPELQAALTDMFAVLDDPATRVVQARPSSQDTGNTADVTAFFAVTWADGGIAVLHACYSASTGPATSPDFEEVATRGSVVILDLRAEPAPLPADPSRQRALEALLEATLPRLLNRPLSPTTERYLKYEGYPPASLPGPGIYRRSLRLSAPAVQQPESERRVQLAIVVNSETPNVFTLLDGARAAGAKFLFEGTSLDASIAGARTFAVELPFGLQALLRTSDLASSPNGRFVPDEIAPADDARRTLNRALELAKRRAAAAAKSEGGAPTLRPLVENPYVTMAPPGKGYRVLALFRFWNVIEYFFAYKDLLDVPWEQTLRSFIPRFQAAETEAQYVQAVAELTAEVHDSHVAIGGGPVSRQWGLGWPGMIVRQVEGQMVVMAVTSDDARNAGIEPGDVVLGVDGVPTAQRVQALRRVLPSSTEQAFFWKAAEELLRGQETLAARVELLNREGAVHAVSLVRSRPETPTSMRGLPVFTLLPEGVGYIDLDRVTPAQLNQAFETVRGTDALILDMRGYPEGIFPTLTPYFAERSGVVAAKFLMPQPDGLNLGSEYMMPSSQTVPPARPDRYQGNIVVLINQEAISQAEHTILHIEAARDVTLIGSPTVGANGNISQTVLPGGIYVTFTGLATFHGDGRQLQRVGILPDLLVQPTIAGIRAGRDEVLEAAIRFVLSR